MDKKNDKNYSKSIFGQIVSQLMQKTPDFSNFRVATTNKNHACLKIELQNENAIDIGGPFRDIFTNIAQEL